MSSPVMAPRARRSLAGPIVLIALGIIFLLGNMGLLTWPRLGQWFAHWWPLLIILWGVVKLVEHYQAQREGVRPAGIGVGGVFLLLLVIGCGLAASSASHVNWHALGDQINIGDNDFPVFGNSFTYSHSQAQDLPAGVSLHVVSDRGSVVINPATGAGLRVEVSKKVVADNQEQADKIDSQTAPVVSVAGTVVTVNANTTGAGEHTVASDLTIYLPGKLPVEVISKRGDISVHSRDADVKISSSKGDVQVDNIAGAVQVIMRKGSLTASHLVGDVTLDGRLDDTSISDVKGRVTLTGDYFGDLNLSKITREVVFKSSRTDMEFSKLDGDLSMESGDLRAHALSGPVRLATRAKDIHLDEVSGPIKIENSNGGVELHPVGPLADIQVDNQKGDVDLVLPATAAFEVNAQTHRGDIESDFSELQVKGEGENHNATGSIGHGGPQLQINNQFGDISIRKAG
jgi:DUF4097 and DUF4098 domain-containing protein YvlB